MPLDLHVLGLSLAFILSQDQTLRCLYQLFSFFLKLGSLRLTYLSISFSPRTRILKYEFRIPFSLVSLVLPVIFLSIAITSMFASLSQLDRCRVYFRKRVQSYALFSFWQIFL